MNKEMKETLDKVAVYEEWVKKSRHKVALFGKHLSHIPLYTIIEAYRIPPTKAACREV